MTPTTPDKERWRWVVGWKGYYIVSSHGRVKSVERIIQTRNGKVYRRKARYLRPGSPRHGYLGVNLCRNGEQKTYPVHQLVVAAFIGPCPEGMEIRHFPDRNRTNNRLDNLRYGTKKENAADTIVHGTTSRGERQGSAKLTEKKVRQIRHLCEEGKTSYIKIAKMFEVSDTAIKFIHSRKTWGHLV